MPVTVECPRCRTVFGVDDGYLGQHIKCVSCGGPVPVGFTPAPKRRRRSRPFFTGSRTFLIVGVLVGGLMLALVVTVLVVVVVLARKPSGPGPLSPTVAGDLLVPELVGPDLDPAKWPRMPGIDPRFGPDLTVTLYVSGMNEGNSKGISERLSRMVDAEFGGHSFSSTGNGTDRMTAHLAPVRDVAAFAKRIDFGRVILVRDRTVVIVANKDVSPPPKKK